MNFILFNDNLFEFSENFTGQIIRVTDQGGSPLTEANGLTVDQRNILVNITDNDGM